MLDVERNALVIQHDALVGWTIQRWFPTETWDCVGGHQDAVQIGRLSLIKAVERFDPTRGYKFATFAVLVIRRDLSKLLETEGLIKTPTNSRYRNKDPVLDQYRQKAKSPSSISKRESLLASTALEDPQFDSILVDKREDWLSILMREEIRRKLPFRIRAACLDLSKRQIKMMWLRVAGLTLQSIGDEFGIGKERVRQILRDIWRVLRESKRLHETWELLNEDQGGRK